MAHDPQVKNSGLPAAMNPVLSGLKESSSFTSLNYISLDCKFQSRYIHTIQIRN
jgi:hypothetical protein